MVPWIARVDFGQVKWTKKPVECIGVVKLKLIPQKVICGDSTQMGP